MSRPTQSTKIQTIVVGMLIAIVVIGGGFWKYNDTSGHTQTVTNSQHQLTQISYQGQTGKNALDLLKQHAKVQTKHYSFGDLVTSINGVAGNGPKYWTFYVDGKMASVGASSYTAKNSDNIMWRLQ